MSLTPAKEGPWYAGITGYQWRVLVVASLGWVFDVFEGQIFVASKEAMPDLLPPGTAEGAVAFYNSIAFGAFLVGGAAGGVLFGMLGDRLGRTRTMVWTILTYSAFTCLSAFARAWWQLAACRFLVALGTGGEWAVASALVAEVFPRRARAWSQSLFHASSVLGTYLATLAGAFVVVQAGVALPLPGGRWEVAGWRAGFLLGVLPALLVVWVRLGLREPDRWLSAGGAAREEAVAPRGRVGELFAGRLARRTLVGVGLAAVGLATFWGTHIYGKDALLRAYRLADPAAGAAARKRAEMLGMLLATTGGGLGLVAFGPLAERLGRRGAFLLYHLGGLAAAVLLFQVVAGLWAVALFLPVFGFLTLGMHAGYAVYFPELFPTRLRGTGGGFCFNVGRLLAAPVIVVSGWVQQHWHYSTSGAATLLSLLFLVGACLLPLAPETRGQDLPE